jgi:hypothetical protein
VPSTLDARKRTAEPRQGTTPVFSRARPLAENGPALAGLSIAGAGFEQISPTVAYRFVEVIELA